MKKKIIVREHRGFSLIEIMIVVVIIGMLSAIIVPNVMKAEKTALINKVKSDMSSIETALKMYKLENHRYPDEDAGLEALVNPSEKSTMKEGDGFLPAIPKDPWGNAYIYNRPGEDSPYDIITLGEDGLSGGDGMSSDIVHWSFK